MITKNDIEILKEIFITKDVFRQEMNKINQNFVKINNKMDMAVKEISEEVFEIKELVQSLSVTVDTLVKREEVVSST